MAKKKKDKAKGKPKVRSEQDTKFDVLYEDDNGKQHETVCKITIPNADQLNEAQKVYNEAFNNAINSKALLRPKLNAFVREQGLWDDAKEAEFKALQGRIKDAVIKIRKGGIKLQEARAVAISLREMRADMKELLSSQNALDNNTAEGQADNAQFNYLVSACTVYNDTGKRVFSDVSDYLNPKVPEMALQAASKYASLMYGLRDDYEESLPENKFLVEWKFADDDLRLIDKDGGYVDSEGRAVDKFGNLVNKEGHIIDENGNLLDDEGNIIITDAQPFLDDDGKPLELPEDEEKEPLSPASDKTEE